MHEACRTLSPHHTLPPQYLYNMYILCLFNVQKCCVQQWARGRTMSKGSRNSEQGHNHIGTCQQWACDGAKQWRQWAWLY
jgi:hypothetical protein